MKPASPSLLQRQHRSFRRVPSPATVLTAALIVLASGFGAPAFAQRPLRPLRPAPVATDPRTLAFTSDSLRVYLVTMGVGEDLYEFFGHDAIWVHDPTQAIDTVYNWGVFDFTTPGFIPRFMLGDMHYTMAGDPLDLTIAFYRSRNRNVWVNELNLTASEKQSLVAFVRWNVLPENAPYRYDYYRDNCSTRVRDALDRVTGGQIRPQLKAIKLDETYRSHTLRLMQGWQPLVNGVELLLGRPTDVKLSADETSFLPVELMRHLRTVKLDGGRRPLLKDGFTLNEATRPPEPATVPRLWVGLVPIGLVLTALVLWLSARSDASIGRRRVLATTVAILAGVFGLLGLIITLLITITDHVAAHSNENIFMLNPLWLIVAVLAPMLILRQRARRTTVVLVRAAGALACVAVLLHLVGLSRQPNWDAIGLVLPVELAIAWVLVDASWARPPRSAVADGAEREVPAG